MARSSDPGASRNRTLRLVAGATIGAVMGAIAAVNIVIFGGVDDGYEATPSQVFQESPLVGVLAVSAFVLCLLAGVVLTRGQRLR